MEPRFSWPVSLRGASGAGGRFETTDETFPRRTNRTLHSVRFTHRGSPSRWGKA